MDSKMVRQMKYREGFNQRFIQAMFAIVVIAIVTSLVGFANLAKSDDVKIRIGKTVQLADSWVIDGTGEAISFPNKLNFSKQGTVNLSTKLPDDITEGNAIFYNCSYCSQKVYVDDELIWTFASEPVLPFGNMRGSCYAIIPMKADYAGRTITIVMKSAYDATTTNFEGVKYGNTGDFKFALLCSSVWRLCLFVILASMAIFAFIVGIYHYLISINGANSEFVYFSLLAVCVGGWIFVDPSLVQFFTSNLVVTQYLSFVCLLGVGCFYSGLCAVLYQGQKRFFQINELVGYTLTISMILLYIFDLVDPVGFMYIIYAYACYSLISTFVMLSIHYREYTYAKPMFFGTVVLIVGIGTTVIVFLSDPMGTAAVYPFAISYTLYVFVLFIMLINKEVELVRVSAQVNTYKNLAYMDVMTRIPNRAAYERDIDEIMDDNQHKKEVTLIIGDLNYLKYTNDHYGHEIGDELIKAAANTLELCFNGLGKYYRLGGDEFAVILINQAKPTIEYIEKLHRYVDDYNRTSDTELSFALGYATRSLPSNNPEVKADLFREADNKMYDNKIRMHKARI